MDVTSKIEQAKEWLDQQPPAIEHQQGSVTTINVTRVLYNGFTLSPEEMFEAIQSWNQRCEPPWSNKELIRKCEEATKMKYDRPYGFMLKNKTIKKQRSIKRTEKQKSEQQQSNSKNKKREFKPYSRGGTFKNCTTILTEWTTKKKGISVAALEQVGAEVGLYQSQNVILIRIFSPQETEQQCGDVMLNADGSNVAVKNSEGKKYKLVIHSESGIIGKYVTDALKKRQHKKIIKAAGISDHLAIQTKLIESGLCDEYLSFTNSCGETENPDKYIPLLKSALNDVDYYVIADNDETGKAAVKKWAKAGLDCGARTRIITLPQEIDKTPIKDVRDFFLAGKSLGDLFEIINVAPLITESDCLNYRDENISKKALEEIGIIVFGQDNQMKISIYSTKTKRINVINDISKFTYEQLIQIAGRIVQKKILPINTPASAGIYNYNPTFIEIRREIASQASENNIKSHEKHGLCFYVTENGTVVCVCGDGDAFSVSDNKLSIISKPFCNGICLDLT
jgi:hypothetical protein